MSLRKWLALVAIAFLPGTVLAQPPRGGGEFGGRMRGFGGGDPSAIMDMFFKGKDSIDLNELQEPVKSMVQRIVSSMGITGDRITRQQMEEGAKQLKERFASGGGMTFKTERSDSSGDPRSPFGDRSRGDRGERGRGMDDSDSFAEGFFRRSDKDNDGVLSAEEMSDALRDERDKWDLNRDGFIELSEYKTFFAARMQQNMKDLQDFRAERRDDGEEPERKPTLFRAGKLPRELPSWFAQLDTNADAQVGLYEWRAGHKPLNEFKPYDRNGDNFLTVEEVLLYVKLNKPSNGGDSFAANTPGRNQWEGRMPGMPGMPNGDANPFGRSERTFTFPGSDRTPGGRDSSSGKDGGRDRSRMPGFTPGSMPTNPWGGGEGANPFGRTPRGEKSGRDDKDSKRNEMPKMPFSGKRGKR